MYLLHIPGLGVAYGSFLHGFADDLYFCVAVASVFDILLVNSRRTQGNLLLFGYL